MPILKTFMGNFFRNIAHNIERMGTQEYIIAVAVALAIGYFCFKGFSSHTEY